MGATEDEWHVPASDDESSDVWEPEPKYIVEMYNKLAKGESLPLEWALPVGGRRSPSPEREETEEAMEEDGKEEEKTEEKQEPTEFDFDDITQEVVTPKRAPGSAKTSRSAQRRVATLEKIMGDIVRHKKLNTPKQEPVTTPSSTATATTATTPTTPATPATTTTTTAAAKATASQEQTPSKAGGNLSPKRL